jgi:hypothetical protein
MVTIRRLWRTFFNVPIAIHTSCVAFLCMLFSSIPRSCIPRGSPLRDREYEYLGFDDRSAPGSWLLPPAPPPFCFPLHWIGAPTRHLPCTPPLCSPALHFPLELFLWDREYEYTGSYDRSAAGFGLCLPPRPLSFPTALARRAYIWHLPCVPFSLFPGDALFTNCIPGPRIRVYLLACRLQRFAAFSLQP